MLVYIALGVLIGLGLSYLLFFLVRSHMKADKSKQEEILKNQFMSLSQEALKGVSENFLHLAKSHLEKEAVRVSGEFSKEKDGISTIVSGLKEQLNKYQDLMRDFEKDRSVKYTSIEEQMKNIATSNESLRSSTHKLNEMLSNVKVRGQWGERMAEDILSYSGLQKGMHFDKNTSFDTTQNRPDYIFYLPNNNKLAMDVKFPFNNYQNFIHSSSDHERQKFQKDFLNDVKARINEITKRDYILSAEGTLDYVILFIPSEQVYNFVNEIYSGVIDETLKKKVILCSPWTLYAVLRIIWQAWQNYSFSEGLKEVIAHVHSFMDEFEKFKEKMDVVGSTLEKAQKAFDDLRTTRQRQLERKMDKIKEHGMGEEVKMSDDAILIKPAPNELVS